MIESMEHDGDTYFRMSDIQDLIERGVTGELERKSPVAITKDVEEMDYDVDDFDRQFRLDAFAAQFLSAHDLEHPPAQPCDRCKNNEQDRLELPCRVCRNFGGCLSYLSFWEPQGGDWGAAKKGTEDHRPAQRRRLPF